MSPTLLATTLLLLGQAPAAPFPTLPPTVGPASAVVAEESPAAAPSEETLEAHASEAPFEATPEVPTQPPAAAPASIFSDSSTEGPALVPIGESPAVQEPLQPASTASLPDLGQPPVSSQAELATPPTAAIPPASEPAELQLPQGAELRSVLIEAAADTRADTTVQPTTGQEPLATPASARISQTVLRELLTRPEGTALAGHPTRLATALPLGGEQKKQIEAVQAYWDSTLRTAVYHATLADIERLASVPAPASPREKTVFEQALLAAEANTRQAELKAVDAQYVLAEKAGIEIDELLPLPADEPLTGGYRTNYNTLFSGRTAPVNLRRIDRTLPMCQRLLETRAASLVAAEEVWETELSAYGRGEVSLELLLVSFDRLGSQRIAFLELVRRYNYDIAEYALSVSTTTSNRESTVGMLIETNGTSATVRPASGVIPQSTNSEGVIFYGDTVPAQVIQSGPTPAAPVGTQGRVPQGGYIVPGQPSPAVRPVPGGTPSLTPTPASRTPEERVPGSTSPAPAPAFGAAGTTLPTPAEVAGNNSFRDVTPGGPGSSPGAGGEIRLAQATEPALPASSQSGHIQPATHLAPQQQRIVETPAPPGLEGTRSVLVRP